MKRRFVVAVDKPTPQQAEAINFIFRDHYPWWHWIAGLWLVVDATGALNARWIRDRVGEIAPGVRSIVLEVSSADWAGVGKPPPAGMFDWVRSEWD